ncbi:ATPase, T2SS/T4P/T4SS family [Halobaculum sp. MBLA0147]|uniref:ATPase, T2SS/T4P/T4SS family n=1 Tax=Halobaculum sp. MBLA0147 TaxID=3079934 RepID=UPI003523902C
MSSDSRGNATQRRDTSRQEQRAVHGTAHGIHYNGVIYGIPEDVSDHFFTITADEADQFENFDIGEQTLTTQEDLEHAIPDEDKPRLRERERYWVNKPYAFVVICEDRITEEFRYFVIEPALTETQRQAKDFLSSKARSALETDELDMDASPKERARALRTQVLQLLRRYQMIDRANWNKSSGVQDFEDLLQIYRDDSASFSTRLQTIAGHLLDGGNPTLSQTTKEALIHTLERQASSAIGPSSDIDDVAYPTHDDGSVVQFNRTDVSRIMHYLIRDNIGFGKLEAIFQDELVEDIHVSGYNSNVLVSLGRQYEGDVITNVEFGQADLDSWIQTNAEAAGKGISRQDPTVDAELSDGSRVKLTLGEEITDGGSNFTIRKFSEVPHTPVDLVCWDTFSLDEMAYLWLMVEQGANIIVAGGTASGKTTTLNALSLFVDAREKVLSIEDTREIEIPHVHWTKYVTREGSASASTDTIGHGDLVKGALRERPNNIILGEVRDEEATDHLFEAMSTGHRGLTTFHADSAQTLVNRFIDNYNVAPSQVPTLDLLIIQSEVTMDGQSVRRAERIQEVSQVSTEGDQKTLKGDEPFYWTPTEGHVPNDLDTDLMAEVREHRGWTQEGLEKELETRKAVLAYLIDNDIRSYQDVAAALQGYTFAQESLLGEIGAGTFADSVDMLHNLQYIDIDIPESKEAKTERPEDDEIKQTAKTVLNENEEMLSAAASVAGDGFDPVVDEVTGRMREDLRARHATRKTPHQEEPTAESDDGGTQPADDPGQLEADHRPEPTGRLDDQIVAEADDEATTATQRENGHASADTSSDTNGATEAVAGAGTNGAQSSSAANNGHESDTTADTEEIVEANSEEATENADADRPDPNGN